MLRERQQPGIDSGREVPFASCLRASGFEVPKPIAFRGEPPTLEDLYDKPISYVQLSSTRQVHIPNLRRPEEAVELAVRPTVEPEVVEVAHVNPYLRLPFKEWLKSMDDSLFLMQYHDNIAANFDSLEQVHEIYVRQGELRSTFFEDAGIKKLGHRRIFEKWFREHCG